MSLRVDTSSWIAGALLCGDSGLGVLGSDVPSSGDNGAGYLYNDLSLPADANKEVCGRITSWPSAGTLTAYEDSSFTFEGAPDGSYTFAYQLYVDGVATGSPATVSLLVGSAPVTIDCTAGNAAAAGQAASIQQAATIACSAGNATAAGQTASITQAATIACSVGTAVAAGITTGIVVTGPAVISCSVGNAVASGVTASIGGLVIAAARKMKVSDPHQRRANLSGARPSNRQ